MWFFHRNTEPLLLHVPKGDPTEIMIGCEQESQFKLKQVQKGRKAPHCGSAGARLILFSSFPALINGLSQIPPHQKKTVYLCQLLIRIAQGKSLGLKFENDQRISPLESALSFWTLLEREENKLEKLHEDIRRLIQIQIVAVLMENRYFKEAAEALERLFTDSESDKPLRVKLATVIKTKDPYVPLLQSFSYSLLINKVKSYIKLSMKENETNFLIQLMKALYSHIFITVSRSRSYRHILSKKIGVRWTYKEDSELKSGIRKFGVGNWAKILAHGNFNNRTSVMLKDRWRTLSKINAT
uniref:Telomeric repeat binding factor 1 n=1 Tax=Zosterops lateralis melanops TaxID=1220523 RepID=A0A8D2PYM3_ZOSLA